MSIVTDDPTIPPDPDRLLAREASRVLNVRSSDGTALKVQIVASGREDAAVELPSAATALLRTMLNEMAAGRVVTVVPIATEITTWQAAEILNVSRPFVASLIDKGTLPARMVGAHRRVQLDDVLAYKRESKTKARAALKEMVAISQELGLE